MLVEIICSRALQYKFVKNIGPLLLGNDLSPFLLQEQCVQFFSQMATWTDDNDASKTSVRDGASWLAISFNK